MQSQEAQKAKKSLRKTLATARAELAKNPETASMLSSQLSRLAADVQAKTVAAYLPFGDEPDITVFLNAATADRIRLLMPVSQANGHLTWVEYRGDSAPGIFGFLEPLGNPAALSEAELILIPASAADSRGNRLGKGKGFYDRALADLPPGVPVAAVVYDSELIDNVPVEAHDRPVSFVVTPERTVSVAKTSMG